MSVKVEVVVFEEGVVEVGGGCCFVVLGVRVDGVCDVGLVE